MSDEIPANVSELKTRVASGIEAIDKHRAAMKAVAAEIAAAKVQPQPQGEVTK